jgi:hypothetical protein
MYMYVYIYIYIYISPTLTTINSAFFPRNVFPMILRVTSDYFPKQDK